MDRAFQQILRYGVVACCLLITACNKDRTPGAAPSNSGQAPPVTGTGERNVYIACEGSFGNGNASLYMQNLASLTLYENVYLNVNDRMIGDVFQSIQRIDDRLFLCVNNSDKILVVDAKTRNYQGTINIPKPRYILPINSDKAYVSTLYSNKVYIINPRTLQILTTIEVPAKNPEGMLLRGSKVYICPWDTASNKVYIADIVTDNITDSFTVAGYAPQHALVDKDGFIWVLSGNAEKKKWAALTVLAPGTGDIVQSYQFNALQDVIKPSMNKAGDILYFIGVDYKGITGYNGIFRMSVNDSKLPATPFIASQKFQYFWGLGIDPLTDDIYVGDPKGFMQKGVVSVYNSSGEQKRTFAVGVGPGYFYFDGE